MDFGLMQQGGGILWIIMAMGLLAFGVFLERAFHLHRARIKSEDFLNGICNILKRGNITEALAICDDTPGPVAYIAKTAILHRKDKKENIKMTVDDACLSEVSRMERRLVVVATVGQMAPLLGLLGTVLGMVDTLLMIQGSGGAVVNSADLMGGLMKALITTAGGLSVAVPCYAAFNLLVVKIDRIVLDMDRVASEIIAFLSDHNAFSEPVSDEK